MPEKYRPETDIGTLLEEILRYMIYLYLDRQGLITRQMVYIYIY